MTREARHARCPESVLGWIPWYADGSLSDRQRGAVEAHAAECADCRAELDIVSGAPFEIDSELPDPERLFEEITARIEVEDREAMTPVIPIERARATSNDDLDRIGRWIHDESEEAELEDSGRVVVGPWTTRTAAWAAAAALALLFLGGSGGALFSSVFSDASQNPAEAVYESATLGAAAGAAVDGPMLDVVFLDHVSAREISNALRTLGVEIVSGPTNLGVYRLRLTKAAEDGRISNGADIAAVAARLKAPEAAVAIFAEAVP